MKKIDFLLAGVGGQGTLMASDILAEVGVAAGYDVKKSEVHGFAQRGGIVESHVRWGEKVLSSLAEKGRADFLLALEMLEGARWAGYLKAGGMAVINRQHLPPLTVTAGDVLYPEDERMEQAVKAVTDEVYFVDGVGIAEELGTTKVSNTVVLGFVSSLLDVPPDTWLQVIEKRVPRKFVEVNKEAFRRGRELGEQKLKR
ncbi:MAG: indolepyruvate oxidoreductase subunit beta [Anaerolineae bacterium]